MNYLNNFQKHDFNIFKVVYRFAQAIVGYIDSSHFFKSDNFFLHSLSQLFYLQLFKGTF